MLGGVSRPVLDRQWTKFFSIYTALAACGCNSITNDL
jgi:hypothetical protein